MGTLIDIGNNNRDPVIINNLERECASEVDLTSEYLKTKNKLAEFVTKQDKKEARDNLDICSETIPYESPEYSNIENVKQALDIALKKDFCLEYFTVSPATYDINNYLESLTVKWKFTKTPDKIQLIINNQTMEVTGDTIIIERKFIGNINITIKGYFENEVISNNISVKGLTPLYFGVSQNYYQNQKLLTSDTSGEFNIQADDQDYIYILTPFELILNVNGIDGGFEKLVNIYIDTQMGTTIKYYVYKSDYAGLGKTTVLWRQK